MLKINFNPKVKAVILLIIKNFFLVFYFLFVAFSLMEIIKPKIITNYINLNIFILVLLSLGVVTLLFYQPKQKDTKKLNFLDYLTIILFSVLIGIAVFYLVKGIGFLAILVGLASAIISYFFIVLNYQE